MSVVKFLLPGDIPSFLKFAAPVLSIYFASTSYKLKSVTFLLQFMSEKKTREFKNKNKNE